MKKKIEGKIVAIIVLIIALVTLLGVALGIGLSGLDTDTSTPTQQSNDDGWTNNY